MFGKTIKFDESKMYLQNLKGEADTNYIGYHVVFPEPDHKIVGEIVAIEEHRPISKTKTWEVVTEK